MQTFQAEGGEAMSVGKCCNCGKDTDNFIEWSDWLKSRYPEDGDGYWKCPECVAYTVALYEWENEQYGTSEITCPWCGYEFSDSWEYGDDDDACECPDCGKLFSYTRDIEVTYTSKRRKCDFDFEAVKR